MLSQRDLFTFALRNYFLEQIIDILFIAVADFSNLRLIKTIGSFLNLSISIA